MEAAQIPRFPARSKRKSCGRLQENQTRNKQYSPLLGYHLSVLTDGDTGLAVLTVAPHAAALLSLSPHTHLRGGCWLSAFSSKNDTKEGLAATRNFSLCATL